MSLSGVNNNVTTSGLTGGKLIQSTSSSVISSSNINITNDNIVMGDNGKCLQTARIQNYSNNDDLNLNITGNRNVIIGSTCGLITPYVKGSGASLSLDCASGDVNIDGSLNFNINRTGYYKTKLMDNGIYHFS